MLSQVMNSQLVLVIINYQNIPNNLKSALPTVEEVEE